jgi:nitroreductase
MKFETSVIEIIKKRQSRRSFISKDFSSEQIQKINVVIQSHSVGPFGNKVMFRLIEKKFAKENHKVKLGTYGFISGARYFIAGQVKNDEHANEDYGYLLETIILHLTAMGFGTCWLGGTFSRNDFLDILNSDGDTIIPAITPVGFPTETNTVRENVIRWGAKADSRKKWEELFFTGSFTKPLSKEDAGSYEVPLEMIRLAPSASNKQPWRIEKTPDAIHFYLKRTAGYNRIGKGVDLQKIDMGIAMSHFELACGELNLKGKWANNNPGLASEKIDEYCISWLLKNAE